MKPWQRAKQCIEGMTDAVSFEELLASCIQHGVVYSSETSFYLIQRCYWDGVQPFFYTDKHNAWFVHLASGSIKDMFSKSPETLEHIIFQRHGRDKYHAYNFNKMKEKYGIKS